MPHAPQRADDHAGTERRHGQLHTRQGKTAQPVLHQMRRAETGDTNRPASALNSILRKVAADISAETPLSLLDTANCRDGIQTERQYRQRHHFQLKRQRIKRLPNSRIPLRPAV